jgi:ribosomal protein L37AE/L43A
MSWEQLVDIIKVNEDLVRQERSQPPVSCPKCGEPLVGRTGDSVLDCPNGDYQWPSNQIVTSE